MKGYTAFVLALISLCALVVVITDLAKHIGCFTDIKDSVIAITVLAFGTSVPG